MALKTLYRSDLHPRRLSCGLVSIEISIDDEADYEHSIPSWAFAINVRFNGTGESQAILHGAVEAVNIEGARLRIAHKAITLLGESIATLLDEKQKQSEQIVERTSQARWWAWGIEHDSHGPSIDTLVWLPSGDKPETTERWVRLPWLDSPANGGHDAA